MRTKCVSVRLKSLTEISNKAYKAVDFNGNEDIIPVSCVFGYDLEVRKSDAFWISMWIMEKKNLSFSPTKTAWFEDGKMLPSYDIRRHEAPKISPVGSNIINNLKKL